MKYMLLMNARAESWRAYFDWPPADLKAHIDFMRRFGRELRDSGELVTTQGLAGPDQAKVVRATKGGGPAVTDGPFPEAKEFLAGYWIVDVDSPAPTTRGPGGAPLYVPIEVREVMSAPPVEL